MLLRYAHDFSPQHMLETPDQYNTFLQGIKQDVQAARLKAHISVNQELILLYWRIGHEILSRKQALGWGSSVIKQLSQDLKNAFPEMKGWGERNLVYMQTFASSYPDYEFTQTVSAQITWSHNQMILDKVKDPEIRVWYIEKTIENGWSRNVLLMHIENQSHLKLGKAQTNFSVTLPKPHSDLAQQLIKNEYNFEFLGLTEDVHEKMIEKGLITQIRDFLLELGNGFAYLGNQYKITVGSDDFFIDLLFYHVRLRCYIVIELKTGKFKPEHAGQLNFYITAIDRQIKNLEDNPTIGLLLCQHAESLVVEYSLETVHSPMGVAHYRTLSEVLPENLETYIPTPEQFRHLMAVSKQAS